jgi:hypothetical protein
MSVGECGSLSDALDTFAAKPAVRVGIATLSLDVRRKTGIAPGTGERAQQDGGWCLLVMNRAGAVEPAVLVEIPRTSLGLYAIWACS